MVSGNLKHLGKNQTENYLDTNSNKNTASEAEPLKKHAFG